jgi:hypothetical protein
MLLLPAGPNDRTIVRSGGAAALVPGGTDPDVHEGDVVVALDLDGRAEPAALARGEEARAGFAAALLRLGAAKLAAGGGDDLARLVPDYVSLPRGVARESGEVAWSRDPR